MPTPTPHEVPPAPLATELWFRSAEIRQLLDQKKTTSVRLGDRTDTTTDPKGGYKEGAVIAARLREESGERTESHPIVVTRVQKLAFADIPNDAFQDCLAGQCTHEEIVTAFEQYYGRAISGHELVTLVSVELVSSLASLEDLVRTKMLTPAMLPRDNPTTLTAPASTIPLIAEDYPAKTAVMWNAAYRTFGLPFQNLMHVGDPGSAKELLDVLRRDARYVGGGAGVGFKDEVVEHLDALDTSAKRVGAVNFIGVTEDRQLVGYNTDGLGYARSLAQYFEARGESLVGKEIVMLGAGGTANAIAFALAEHGATLVILNRTIEKAEQIAGALRGAFPDSTVRTGGERAIADEVRDADVVLNVSTKGATGPMERYSALAPASLPATEDHVAANLAEAERVLATIRPDALMSDIVLTKGGTPFLTAARNAGRETLDGIPMVVEQGVEAFWLAHGTMLLEKGISKEQLAQVMRAAAAAA